MTDDELDVALIQLLANGDVRPTGEWIICAVENCEAQAHLDGIHQPPDGQRVYVPICRPHLLALANGERLGYVMEMHGFLDPRELH